MNCGASERTPMTTGKRRLLAVGVTFLTVIWMVVIFAFSSQPDTESSEVSGRVSYQLVEGWNTAFQLGHTEAELEAPALRIEFPVRKCAHMTEYAILALLVLTSIAAWRGRPVMKHYGMALLLAFLYACTDEFHQLFVPGRYGSIADVLLDTCGGAFGMFACLIVGNRKRKNGRSVKNREGM